MGIFILLVESFTYLSPYAMNIRRVNHRHRWYTIYEQEWGTDCGPTCVAIAKKILKGVGSDIDWLRKHTNTNLVSPGIQARINDLNKNASQTGSNQRFQPRAVGTRIGKVTQLARAIGLKASYRSYASFSLLSHLQTSSHQKVFICRVDWKLGGSHAVVVPYVDPGGEVVVLDPYYGLVTTNNCPGYPGGQFHGDVIEISA